MDTFASLIAALNQLTPIGLAGLVAVLVYALFSKKSPLRQMKDNHLNHMQEALDTLVKQGEKQVEHLETIKVDMAIVKDRLPRIKVRDYGDVE